MFKNPLSFQLKADDFVAATAKEKEDLIQVRPSVSFWKDAFRRLVKNKIAMICFFVIVVVMLLCFAVPYFYPYTYKDSVSYPEVTKEEWLNELNNNYSPELASKLVEIAAINGKIKPELTDLIFADTDKAGVTDLNAKLAVQMAAEMNTKVDDKTVASIVSSVGKCESLSAETLDKLAEFASLIVRPDSTGTYLDPGEDAASETLRKELGKLNISEALKEKIGTDVFPHFLGTDEMGRDFTIRVIMGGRVSLLVGLVASVIILIIGSIYGSISGFFGGWVDMIMMRIVDIIYTIPDILLIVLLSFALEGPLDALATVRGFGWITLVGRNLISIFIVFALLYWVGMARIVRSQVLTIKNFEYVTAAKALGAKNGRIIKKHLLTNCIGTLIVTTTLQIPSSIFTESFLSFLGLGVAIPMPSLGSLASDGVNGGLEAHPLLWMAPAILISLIILSFNLFGDGLRDAFDPKMKK